MINKERVRESKKERGSERNTSRKKYVDWYKQRNKVMKTWEE